MKKYLMGLAVGLLAGCCLLLGWQLGGDAKDDKAADLPQMEEVMPQTRQQDAAQTQEQTFTVTARTAPVKNAVGRTQMATQLPAKRPPRA